jgi:hypothetical protein
MISCPIFDFSVNARSRFKLGRGGLNQYSGIWLHMQMEQMIRYLHLQSIAVVHGVPKPENGKWSVNRSWPRSLCLRLDQRTGLRTIQERESQGLLRRILPHP